MENFMWQYFHTKLEAGIYFRSSFYCYQLCNKGTLIERQHCRAPKRSSMEETACINSVFELALWKILEILPSALESIFLEPQYCFSEVEATALFCWNSSNGHNLSLNPGCKLPVFLLSPPASHQLVFLSCQSVFSSVAIHPFKRKLVMSP